MFSYDPSQTQISVVFFFSPVAPSKNGICLEKFAFAINNFLGKTLRHSSNDKPAKIMFDFASTLTSNREFNFLHIFNYQSGMTSVEFEKFKSLRF